MLDRKSVRWFKKTFVTGIIELIQEGGTYYCLITNKDSDSQVTVYEVNSKTEYLPGCWGAGIDQPDYKFGNDLSLQEFADEEALRTIRNIFPNHADFITWAWNN